MDAEDGELAQNARRASQENKPSSSRDHHRSSRGEDPQREHRSRDSRGHHHGGSDRHRSDREHHSSHKRERNDRDDDGQPRDREDREDRDRRHHHSSRDKHRDRDRDRDRDRGRDEKEDRHHSKRSRKDGDDESRRPRDQNNHSPSSRRERGHDGSSSRRPESDDPRPPHAQSGNADEDDDEEEEEMDEEQLVALRRKQRQERVERARQQAPAAPSAAPVERSTAPTEVAAHNNSAAVVQPPASFAAHKSLKSLQQQQQQQQDESSRQGATPAFSVDDDGPVMLERPAAPPGPTPPPPPSMDMMEPIAAPKATPAVAVPLASVNSVAPQQQQQQEEEEESSEESSEGEKKKRAAQKDTTKSGAKRLMTLREMVLKLKTVEERLMAHRQREEIAAQAKAQKEVDMFSMSPVAGDNIFGTAGAAVKAAAAGGVGGVRMKDNFTDVDGYLVFRTGDMLADRYEILATHGKGVFSSVFAARDTLAPVDAPDGVREVAVKVIRNNETMFKAAQKEIELLNELSAADPSGKKHCVRLLSSFEWEGHMCLVFENMDCDLRDLVKKHGRGGGINLNAVRIYGRQLFAALKLCRSQRIMHCDLKPDNILINKDRNSIKLCDFGSAAKLEENESTPYLVSRFYRAPEIIQGLPYDNRVDVWSAACTLFEMFTGKILFPGEDNTDMLKLIMETRGKMTSKMIRRGEFSAKYFDESNAFVYYAEDKGMKGRAQRKVVASFGPPHTRSLESLMFTRKMTDVERQQGMLLKDLLEKTLVLDPTKRMQPNEALDHPFFKPLVPAGSAGGDASSAAAAAAAQVK